MFNHCQTFAELNDAYEQAVTAVTTEQTFEQAMDDLAAGRAVAEDDRIPRWDAIREAMHVRWSELSGKPWTVDTTLVLLDPRHYEDSDRPDMEP